MTHPWLALEGVSHVLPDGRTLFSDLHERFDQRRTGLVGRNGVGKSLLARMLAGQLSPGSGRCLRSGPVHYLAQQVSTAAHATVADLAGLRRPLDALARIAAGSCAPADFDAVGERWDLPQRLAHELARHGLGHLEAGTPASRLSGGEAMRVALVGAMQSDADFLVLDEPSNHLDREQRRALIEQLRHWPRGLLVVSHDRQLLETVERTVELSSLGLRSHGGNYGFYAASRAQAQQNALQQLEQCKAERQREERALREQRERQARRQARGDRQGRDANQAKILLGRQKERSEGTAGRLRQQQGMARQQLAERVRAAAQQVQHDASIRLHAVPLAQAPQRRAVALDAVVLPHVQEPTRHIDLVLQAGQRVGVVGPNACGKSTLLQVLAGRLAPLAGRCQTLSGGVHLDQHLAQLDPARTVFAQMRAAHATASDGALRMRLAQLDLGAHKIMLHSGALSGGERLKAALACLLYADPPPLLLLDEPSNHLDLPSAQALEAMLRSYAGTLLVVSHDDAFLDQLGLTDRLVATDQGWRLAPW